MREIDGKLPGEIHSPLVAALGSKASNALCLCANDQQQIKFHLSHYLFWRERERSAGAMNRGGKGACAFTLFSQNLVLHLRARERVAKRPYTW
jgi:hypothetical protein